MYKTIVRAGIQKHKEMLLGISVLIFMVSLALGTVLTVWTNSTNYLHDELRRAGFGTVTAWVSGIQDTDEFTNSLIQLEPIQRIESQEIIFSNYTSNGQESDTEGQLISTDSRESRYRFFKDDLQGYLDSAPDIAEGEVYVPPSLISIYGIQLGDTIQFAIARNGESISLTVKGYYEDPFMGSSMIGMKGFLVSPSTLASISSTITDAGLDALAREGAMIHIFARSTSTTTSDLIRFINHNSDLPVYSEFVHSAESIHGFMLILQNAFSALLIAFVLVLLLVVLVALGHGITSNISADYVNMGILKSIGFTSSQLRNMQLLQFAAAIFPSMILGLIFVVPASKLINNATITTTGILVPSQLSIAICFATFAILLIILGGFIRLKTSKIQRIHPMIAIRGEIDYPTTRTPHRWKINGYHLHLSMAIKNLATYKKKYISTCIVAILLVFFASTIGRMDDWLGKDGKGMMDAFNPADHDIGVQMFGQSTLNDAQDITRTYTEITDSYQLAMVSASVNGVDYSANVITEPERFHILDGKTSTGDNEIVITEFVADELDVFVGDVVSVTGDLGSGEYTISGIYSCANDMGGNIGMSREGYLRISKDNPQLWCDHYFLQDPSQKAEIIQALATQFGGDVHVHENTWPGLLGIISAMRMLVNFMYMMVALFTLIIVVMAGSKILASEKSNMGIYKSLGFTDHQLRLSFALRFAVVATIGSILGAALSACVSDAMVSSVMKLAGISNFTSSPTFLTLAFPTIFVTLLFTYFAYFAAGKIKKTACTVLMTE